MNIVKFKDIYLKDTPQYTQEEIDWFNDNLKGKYAYAVNWSWVVPFSDMSLPEYVECSRSNNVDGFNSCAYQTYIDYVDEASTENANSIDRWAALNNFVSDDDITLEEVKQFRTWLASTLLSIKDDTDMVEGEKTMLEYYAGGMYDSTIASLMIFANTQTQYSTVMPSSCGCTKFNSASAVTVSGTCDPIAIYRRGIYGLMVKLWSVNTYWTDLDSVEFLTEFKKYVDAVVTYNLPLYTVDWTNVFSDCTCINSADALQQAGLTAMRNLSKALQYMIDGDVNGHKNFIDSSLRVFASQYYERMYWI